ncbi:MAG: hypothetical protein ACTSQP_14520 [Promethearchaeota archaeon]
MYQLVIQKYKDKISQIAEKLNDFEIILALQLLTTTKFEYKPDEEIKRYEKKEKKLLLKMLADVTMEFIAANPQNSLGLLLLSLIYFAQTNFKKAYDYANKACQRIEKSSELYKISYDLIQEISEHLENYPELFKHIDELEFDIKETSAKKLGYTLLCPNCGNFNDKKAKYCRICKNKLPKKKK